MATNGEHRRGRERTVALLEEIASGRRGEALRAQVAAWNREATWEQVEEAFQEACARATRLCTGQTMGEVYTWLRTTTHRDRDLHRIALIERCVANGVPFFDLATDTDNRAGLVYGGRVLFSGDRVRCPFCMDLLDQDELREDTMTEATREAHDRIYGVDRDALDGTGPSVVSINGVVASLAVTEFMVWRTGLRSPNGLLTYRADQGGVRISRDQPREGCPFCGDQG